MWLFLPSGFVSLVAYAPPATGDHRHPWGEASEWLLARAFHPGALVRAFHNAPGWEEYRTDFWQTLDADYPLRMLVHREFAAARLAMHARSVTYSNFKAEAYRAEQYGMVPASYSDRLGMVQATMREEEETWRPDAPV